MVKVVLLKMESNATSLNNSDEGARFEYITIKLDENLVLISGTDFSDYKSYLYFNIYRKEKVNFQVMDTDTWMHKPSLNAMTNDTLKSHLRSSKSNQFLGLKNEGESRTSQLWNR